MDVKYFNRLLKEIKFGLIFFCLALIGACGREDDVRIERVDYENNRAVGVTFTTEIDVEKLRVFVGEESKTSVIGVIVSEKDKHSFTPVIPFTPGQRYTLRRSDTIVMAAFTIPEKTKAETGELLAIYPQVDTVPENLLKMYFEFAQPMQEVGNALGFITVTNDTDGIETKPFLRLESELWNKERTVLTLWLEPGRIKTDLIPNRDRGLPLTKGKRYTIAIDSSWKSVDGTSLKKGYSKELYVGVRDDQRPNMDKWQLQMLEEGAFKNLNIDFKESLDAFLATETIRIYDANNNTRVKGRFKLIKNGSVLRFAPDSEWSTSEIEIRVESRLEDLAGNNLNRLFDTPVSDDHVQEGDTHQIHSLRFKIDLK